LLQILVDNSYPQPKIVTPDPALTWSVGDVISFAGTGYDADDAAKSPSGLPPSAFSWSVVLMHCPSDCHPHALQDFAGVTGGKITAPDHEYPSYLQLRLTVTDSTGLSSSTTVKLQPKTTYLRFETDPPGLGVAVGPVSKPSPFELRVIDGSLHSVSVPLVQMLNGSSYGFLAWSDRGAASHEVRAGSTLATYKASFAQTSRSAAGDAGDPPAAPIQQSGCSCALASRSHGGHAVLVLVAAGLWAKSARRRRRGSHRPDSIGAGGATAMLSSSNRTSLGR
jgi:hypothetical protein